MVKKNSNNTKITICDINLCQHLQVMYLLQSSNVLIKNCEDIILLPNIMNIGRTDLPTSYVDQYLFTAQCVF